MLHTTDMPDPIKLKQSKEGEIKYRRARASISGLKNLVEPYRQHQSEVDEIRRRAETQKAMRKARQSKSEQILEIKRHFQAITFLQPQERGLALESVLNELFEVHELDARGPFTLVGEQIDGKFALDGTDIMLGAKWHMDLISSEPVIYFDSKVLRRLDNTLGLFVSINGFPPPIQDHLGRVTRHKVIFMDGGDLTAILEEYISLGGLFRRKKSYAAQTGNIFLSAWTAFFE